ncbi:MAG: hypothetical protein ACFCU4_07395 [Puniceicoccaceae bacterium]
MSIINDALRKQRASLPRSPNQPAELPYRHQPRRGRDSGQLILIIAGACLVSALSVGLAVYLITGTSAPPEGLTPETGDPSASAGEDSSVSIIASQAASTTAATSSTRQSSAPQEVQAVDPDRQEDVMQASASYIRGLPLVGVRVSEAGNIAIIGGEMHREGDVINPGLNLKITEIQRGYIIFEDKFGNRYRRRI